MALPNLPEGMEWKKVMDTGDLTCDGFYGENGQVYERSVEVGPRTVVVLQGVKKPEPEKKHKGKGKKSENPVLSDAGKGALTGNFVKDSFICFPWIFIIPKSLKYCISPESTVSCHPMRNSCLA